MDIDIDKVIISHIYNYPSSFGAYSYKEARLKVLDYILNGIGSGFSDNKELEYRLGSVNKDLAVNDINPYINGEKIYTGYYDTYIKKIGDGPNDYFEFPKPDSRIERNVLEKDNHKDITYWLDSSPYPLNYYPNFKKEYSTVWQCSLFLDINEGFRLAAIEFYQSALDYFESGRCFDYNYSFPKETEKETQKSIDSMTNMLLKYESWEDISEAYKVEYKGDVYQFQVDRWEKERLRIIGFIKETIDMIDKYE